MGRDGCLGWREEFARVAKHRRLQLGRLDRYATPTWTRGDEDLAEQVGTTAC